MIAARHEWCAAFNRSLGNPPGPGTRGAHPRVCGWLASGWPVARAIVIRDKLARYWRTFGGWFRLARDARARLLSRAYGRWLKGSPRPEKPRDTRKHRMAEGEIIRPKDLLASWKALPLDRRQSEPISIIIFGHHFV